MKSTEITDEMVALLKERKMTSQHFYDGRKRFSSLNFYMNDGELQIDYDKELGDYIYKITNKDYPGVPSEIRERKFEGVDVVYDWKKKKFARMEKSVRIRYEMGDDVVHRFKPSEKEWEDLLAEFLEIMKGNGGWSYG